MIFWYTCLTSSGKAFPEEICGAEVCLLASNPRDFPFIWGAELDWRLRRIPEAKLRPLPPPIPPPLTKLDEVCFNLVGRVAHPNLLVWVVFEDAFLEAAASIVSAKDVSRNRDIVLLKK